MGVQHVHGSQAGSIGSKHSWLAWSKECTLGGAHCSTAMVTWLTKGMYATEGYSDQALRWLPSRDVMCIGNIIWSCGQ